MAQFEKLSFRSATVADACFIAKVVLSAIGRFDFEEVTPEIKDVLRTTEVVCTMDDTLYSYRNARIAEIDGINVGGIVAYDGARYAELRKRTFSIVKETTGIDLYNSDYETQPGEFYIDSLAVAPAFRGNDFGKKIIEDAIAQNLKNGHRCFTLIVDSAHNKVRDYYASLGFVAKNKMNAFGTSFIKMAKCPMNVPHP